MHAGVLIAKLQWFRWEGELSGYRPSQRLGVSHDGFEVLDADDDVCVFLHVEVFKILGVDRNCCFERLLQYFYV